MKKILFAIIPILLVVLTFFFVKTQTFSVSSLDQQAVRFEVPAGTSVKAVSRKLKNEKLVKNETVFYALARKSVLRKIFLGESVDFSLKSGVYRLSPSMDMLSILKILSSGQQEYINISIPEGLSILRIGQKLEESGVCSLDDFKAAASSKKLLEKFNVPAENLEGFLFPDTYFFNPSMRGEDVVQIMVENFFAKIKEIPNFQNLSIGDLMDTVILASIIECEYRLVDEAPLISSVFHNRLKKNIGLYSCATIEYIITDILGRPHQNVITYADLAIDNPYNTYKWAGLPPGPISNPGVVALNASRNPAKTNYYFFRLVDAENGKHVFTKDFNSHVSEGYVYNSKKSEI